jgi:uncharacterized protein YndB with AHSA1/START domain
VTDPTPQSGAALRVERTFDAPAQAVFDAWTNPEVMRRWWSAGDAEWKNTLAEADLRVGGRIRIAMRTPSGDDYAASGEFTEIDPPERLAFTWAWDGGDSRETLIELDFRERDGTTTVVLTHSGLSGEDSVRGHTGGWEEALDKLGRALES